MLDIKTWISPPQLKELPRDMQIGVTCRTCGLHWGESVRRMCDDRHLGAEYVDLLEWKFRCEHDGCDGMVDFAFPAEARFERHARPAETAQTVVRPRPTERFPQTVGYASKAVVKPRTYAPVYVPPKSNMGRRQLSLPLEAAH